MQDFLSMPPMFLGHKEDQIECPPYPVHYGFANILYRDVQSDSFFGGVATAIIFAILLAEKTGKSLRIITRTEGGGKNNFFQLLEREGMSVTKNVEVCPLWTQSM